VVPGTGQQGRALIVEDFGRQLGCLITWLAWTAVVLMVIGVVLTVLLIWRW
jgi:hypothetical protein